MDEVIGYVDVRSAEVATTAIASDVAQVHQDMLDADADAAAAAASAAAAAGTLANAVKKTGETSQSIAGDLAISGDLDVGGDADITGALDVTGTIAGNDASLIGTVTVPTEATGTYTMKSANSTKVKNELDNYAPMVRTTGNQTKAGILTLTTANGLLLNTASGYNELHIQAKGSALNLSLDDTSNDINGVATTRQLLGLTHIYSGGSYDSYQLKIRPRNTIVDSTSTRRLDSAIEMLAYNDGKAEINLVAYKADGTPVRKILGTFDGTSWS